jgi:hypothetical protein
MLTTVNETSSPGERARGRLIETCGLLDAQAYLYAETAIDALVAPGARELNRAIEILHESFPGSNMPDLGHVAERLLQAMLGRG